MFSLLFLLIIEDYAVWGKKQEYIPPAGACIVPAFEEPSIFLSNIIKDPHGDIGAFQSASTTPMYSKDKSQCPPGTNPMPANCVSVPPTSTSTQPAPTNVQPAPQPPQYYPMPPYNQGYMPAPTYVQPVTQPSNISPGGQGQGQGTGQGGGSNNGNKPQNSQPAVITPVVTPPQPQVVYPPTVSKPFRTIKNDKNDKNGKNDCKDSSKDNKHGDPNDPNNPLAPDVIKRTVSTVVQRCDSVTPLDTIRGIDPELAQKIEKIFDYQGHTIIPWDVTEDLNSTKQHPMPNWCLLYQKARDAISVFHQVKDIIGSMISDITTYQRRAKEYLREIAAKLSKNVIKMSDDLEKVRRSKDMTMRNYFMKDFTSLECNSHALIVKYKNLKSWVAHVVKGFSGLFLPLYASGNTGS